MDRRSGRRGPIAAAINKLRRLFKRKAAEPPDDPYAYVMAPKKPKPPYLSAAVAEREPD
jgi:hypothetical protein